eukprot:m.13098 g.13098  ORF g.13098 m.13098 type:complete len:392 (+) comp18942_c0_seq1:552-1727(+)
MAFSGLLSALFFVACNFAHAPASRTCRFAQLASVWVHTSRVASRFSPSNPKILLWFVQNTLAHTKMPLHGAYGADPADTTAPYVQPSRDDTVDSPRQDQDLQLQDVEPVPIAHVVFHSQPSVDSEPLILSLSPQHLSVTDDDAVALTTTPACLKSCFASARLLPAAKRVSFPEDTLCQSFEETEWSVELQDERVAGRCWQQCVVDRARFLRRAEAFLPLLLQSLKHKQLILETQAACKIQCCFRSWISRMHDNISWCNSRNHFQQPLPKPVVDKGVDCATWLACHQRDYEVAQQRLTIRPCQPSRRRHSSESSAQAMPIGGTKSHSAKGKHCKNKSSGSSFPPVVALVHSPSSDAQKKRPKGCAKPVLSRMTSRPVAKAAASSDEEDIVFS